MDGLSLEVVYSIFVYILLERMRYMVIIKGSGGCSGGSGVVGNLLWGRGRRDFDG